MTSEGASQAYGQRAQEYINLLGSIDATAPPDRDLIGAWARKQPEGPILDVGCGPGHWTNWLHEQGMDIEGVDPTSEFVGDAQERDRITRRAMKRPRNDPVAAPQPATKRASTKLAAPTRR